MSAPLTPVERAVALALYRQGGGELDAAAFFDMLDFDAIGRRIAREVTPILAALAGSIARALIRSDAP